MRLIGLIRQNVLLLNLCLPVALLLEAQALLLLFSGSENSGGVYTYFSIHFAASVFMTLFEMKYIPSVYAQERKNVAVFFFVLNFSPLTFGFFVTTIMIMFGLKTMVRSGHEISMDKISFNQISDAYPEIKRIFGEGSLQDTLSSEHAHSRIKIKALSALYNTKNPEAMKHIKSALSDASDEVRLYSFSLIDNFEKELNQKIHVALMELQTESDNVSKGKIYKKLAFLYWDMLYFEISDSNLKHYFITKVQSMIDAAFSLLHNDGTLSILQGRLFLLSGQHKEAEASFIKAEELGAKSKVISTYLAEIAFLKKDFTQVGYWLGQYPTSMLDLKMYSIYRLWVDKK